MKIEITRYDWQLVDGQPKIVIHQVKLMEDDGTYIKFGKLKDVIDLLPYQPVWFGSTTEDGQSDGLRVENG